MTPKHMLTFDVEEYFQVESAQASGVLARHWDNYPHRLEGSVRSILDLLAGHNVKATFFILGWVARNEPQVVRAIADAGHEIASHGMTHSMIGRLTPGQFAGELAESKKVLEDLCGSGVDGFRAPTFSITARTAWALDVLAEGGYRYDSSIFPIRHGRYGVPGAPRWPHLARGPGGGTILELPPLTLRLPGANLPVGGGGYLRLLPRQLIGWCIQKAQSPNRPVMIYLHPWEFDPGQPELPMGRLARWRHRVNLHHTHSKLHYLLDRFQFTTVRSAIQSFTPCPEPYLYG